MLFKVLVWLWKNALEYPLKNMGRPGHAVAKLLYVLLIYIPGMMLAFTAYLLYPPKVIVRTPKTRTQGARE